MIRPDISKPPLDLKQQTFMPSDAELTKGRQIVKITRPYPQFSRLVLRSKDIAYGTTKDAFFNISGVDKLHAPAVLMVESFYLQDEDTASNLAKRVLEIHLRGLSQPRSWDSSKKGTTDVLCTLLGYSYENKSPSADGAGVPVTDPNFLQQGVLNFYFTKGDGSAFSADEFKGDWVMTLLIVPYDESTVY